jgi:DNA repair protein RecO (recombination protein O)
MIKKTDAIVLRSMPFRDQSKILTLYTKSFGKLSAIAKGVRSAQNKFASAFEVGSHISTVLYKKSSRDLQLISDASIKTPFLNITGSLERLGSMHYALELVRVCTEEDEVNAPLFNLLLDTLTKINDVKKNAPNFFLRFQVRLVSLLGFTPTFTACVASGVNLKKVLATGEKELLLVPDLGGVALRSEAIAHGVAGKPISVQSFKLIDYLASSKPDDLDTLAIAPNVAREISHILDVYFRFHIDDLPPLKSREVFSQIS